MRFEIGSTFYGPILVAAACGGVPSRHLPSREAAPAAHAEAPTEADTPPRLLATIDRNHPMVGRIWHVRAQTFVQPDVVIRISQVARFVLLGERHDHPDHHRLQTWMVERLFAAGRAPGLVFEMIDLDQQQALDRYRATHTPTVEGLGTVLAWRERGWPDWNMYAPLAALGLARRLPMRAGNLPQATIRDLVARGNGVLDPAFVRAMRLDRPLSQATEHSLETELGKSHCGFLPPEMVPGMARAQRARDAIMAKALLEGGAGADRGSVLIAGAGHVRRDRGVPTYLDALAPNSHLVSMAFVEVAGGANDPESYASLFESESLPFDFVWFTPRMTDEDPCARFGHTRTAPAGTHTGPSTPSLE